MAHVVAIIGRPNVGKSTLFNRLIEDRKAIVDDMSGVTRDRNYGVAEWEGRTFSVIDTGGYVAESEDIFEVAIREQVHIAMEEADVLIFMVDTTTGPTPLDTAFAHIVRQQPQKVILVANKVDNFSQIDETYAFYELGLGDIMPISAMSGSGTGELLDKVIEMLPPLEPESDEGPKVPRISIVGRPNVGKSSLVNALIGKEVQIVTPIAGTTRDSVDTRYTAFNQDIILVDTAGLRKRSRIKENIEFYSTLRTIRAIETCDVALLMLDATLGLEQQDLSILSQILKHNKGVVILVNKWDLIEKETNTARDMEKLIREKMAPFTDVPILFVSAHERKRLLKALEVAMEVFGNKSRKIPTSRLNEVMLAAVERQYPPAVRGQIIRIKYVTQISASIPTFLFFANHPKLIPTSYQRYLENQLRKHFSFSGVPINVFFRKK